MQNMSAEKYISSASAPNLEREEERDLFIVLRNECSTETEKQMAVDKICLSHVRFVSEYAHRYANQCPMDLQDLIGAGFEGVMVAIERFEIERGHRFATYCGWWINLKIINCIQSNHPISMSQDMRGLVTKLKKLVKETGGKMSRTNMIDSLGITSDKMSKVEAANVSTFSIHTKVSSDDGDCSYEDIIPAKTKNPFEIYERADVLSCLQEVLDEMDPKSVEIVMSKYSDDKIRLQDLADKYGVSPERIRQLRVEATKEVRTRLMNKKA